MRTRNRVVLVIGALLAVALLLVVAGDRPVQAQGDDPTPSTDLIFADTYTLGTEESITGNVIVIAETITLEPGSRITGDAALIGDVISIGGTISGEVTVLGGTITLLDGATLRGSVSLCGADAITRGPEARVLGEYLTGCEDLGNTLGMVVPLALNPSTWSVQDVTDGGFQITQPPNIADLRPGFTLWQRFSFVGIVSLVAGGIAALFMLIMPLRVRRVSDAALASPLTTLGVGLLSMLVVFGVSILVGISLVLVITACLLPILGLAWIALALMSMLGWTGIGLPVGVALLTRLNIRRVSPLVIVTIGAIVLTFLTGLLTLSLWTLPLYLLLNGVLGSWGLGAVILTRLGGQNFPLASRRWRPGVNTA